MVSRAMCERHSLSVMHLDMSQSSTCSSSRLTPASFEVKLQFVKVPSPLLIMYTAPPCKQVDRSTQPHTHTQTHTQTTVSPCIHSFIHSNIFTLSLFHKNEPSITIAIHHNLQSSIHQPCIARTTQYDIRTCTHDVTMTRTYWNRMHLHLYRLPITTLQRYIHTCIEMTTSSHPLNALISIFGGGGGDIDHRVGTAASLLLRVDS